MRKAEVKYGVAYDAGYRGIVVPVAHGWSEPHGYSAGRKTRFLKTGNAVLSLRREPDYRTRGGQASVEQVIAWAEAVTERLDAAAKDSVIRYDDKFTEPNGWRLDVISLASYENTWEQAEAIREAAVARREAQERAVEEAKQGRQSDKERIQYALTQIPGVGEFHLDVVFRRDYPNENAVIIDVDTFNAVLAAATRES